MYALQYVHMGNSTDSFSPMKKLLLDMLIYRYNQIEEMFSIRLLNTLQQTYTPVVEIRDFGLGPGYDVVCDVRS